MISQQADSQYSAAPLSAPHMHADKAGILKGGNSGMGGHRASRTDVKGTFICWQSAKVELMVMESSAGSCERLLESLEATEAPISGICFTSKQGTGEEIAENSVFLSLV